MSTTDLTMTSTSPDVSREIGRQLGAAMAAGSCIALEGGLGAGKTTLIQGVAAGAGVPADVMVNSPTFVIVNEYVGRLHLYHIDAYRLHGGDALLDLGFAEMHASGGAVLVEWANRVRAVLPEDRLLVELSHAGETRRDLRFRASGPTSVQMIASLSASA